MPITHGLQQGDNPFAALKVKDGSDGPTLRQALAKLCSWWTPTLDPARVDQGKLALYRRAVHAYCILRDFELRARIMEAIDNGLPMVGIVQSMPYVDIEAGICDLDWLQLYVQDAIDDDVELDLRREHPFLSAELIAKVASAFRDAPQFIDGTRLIQVQMGSEEARHHPFILDERIARMRLMPEVSAIGLPEGAGAWRVVWRTGLWEADGEQRFLDLRPYNARVQQLWQGRRVAPLWEVTISLAWWLAADSHERDALVHEMLYSSRTGRNPKVTKPSLKGCGMTLARHGAMTPGQAQQILAAARHPRTVALAGLAADMGVADPYQVTPLDEGWGDEGAVEDDSPFAQLGAR